ncbi:DUF1043 family protein [Thalassotalea litorea]|uniref:Z-ring associated protein G n=1 Tax=Thalassotalea litorea TaxID=2020715 RepID=A0A5R9IXP0_9GAMM|nr:DUF1043 family protein [Thalassotalea litorea]TLU66698.1 DUF1043 family protein [Thalassotalea litorea]
MDIIISLSIFVAGLIIGIVATRLLSSSSQENQRLEKEVEQRRSSMESYQQDVAVHLKSSMELLGQMNAACTKAMLQMEKSTDLLNKVNQETNGMPFFGAETEAELQAVAKLQRRKKKVENLTEAPRDYSSDPSGLFDK